MEIYLHYALRYVLTFVCGLAFLISGSPGKENVKVVAHSGYCTAHLENTEQAFIGAAKHGEQGIETDIRFTSDGIPVTFHDGVAVFTDGSELPVSESTLQQLTEKPLKNTVNDEISYVCTLEHYFEICKQYNMVCFLDIKADLTPERVQIIFDMAKEIYDLNMVIPQSSNVDNLILIREYYPTMPIMLTYGRIQYEAFLDYTVCFQYNFGIDCDVTVLDKNMIRQFRERDLSVAVFTCNTKLEMNYAYYLGVDYMETDV